MSIDPAAIEPDREVMAAVDAGRLVIADVSRDDAWLSVPEGAAASLADNR
jgi:hypothetical protein